jgi:hypothetical protein
MTQLLIAFVVYEYAIAAISDFDIYTLVLITDWLIQRNKHTEFELVLLQVVPELVDFGLTYCI